jgi:hypothetical protein
MSHNYSQIIRNIRDEYPNVKFQVKKHPTFKDGIKIHFLESNFSLNFMDSQDWNDIKKVIERNFLKRPDDICCGICCVDNSKLWYSIICSKCNNLHCGKCAMYMSAKAQGAYNCPYCRDNVYEDSEVQGIGLFIATVAQTCRNLTDQIKVESVALYESYAN